MGSGPRKDVPSERIRDPQPVIRRRIASGRGATEQPNSTSDGEAALNTRFWLAIVLAGAAAGAMGAGLMWALFGVQRLAFSSTSGNFEAAVAHSADSRRVLSLLFAGLFGAGAWYLIRRFLRSERSEVEEAIWAGNGRLGWRRSALTSLVSEVVVGMGASIGRESAPKLMGGVAGSILAERFGLSVAQRRLVVACGAGAGMAAVYNVPIAGALFTAEVLWGSLSVPTVLPALACSWIATATAWCYLPRHAIYLGVPDYRFTLSLLVWSLLAGPVIGLCSAAYVRLIGWVSHRRAGGRSLLVALPCALVVLGLVGVAYPQLLGNGQDIAHGAFLGELGIGLLGVIAVLKPLATSLCLLGGASGGLLTPTFSSGAALGGFLGGGWSHLWPGTPNGAYAMVGAVAAIGASMQAPLTALALVLELTGSGFQIVVPMMAAVTSATVLARHLDGYSIYSARLGPLPTAATSSCRSGR